LYTFVDIGYEIRDVMPDAENVLYAFIDEPQAMSTRNLKVYYMSGTLASFYAYPADPPIVGETIEHAIIVYSTENKPADDIICVFI
jgi:hypothetical protein